MMDMLIDVALAVLLALVLVGGVVMTRRLTAFRESREDLAKLVGSLSHAVDKAHAAIADLKAASDGAEATLAKRLHEVRKLSDEVGMMQQAGESLARRLEQAAVAPRRAAQDALQARRVSDTAAPTRGEKLSGLAAQIAALDAARARPSQGAAR
jgi:chromosome segregation ATPase